jgi:methylthioribulose-1-phosphate dehydratase
MNDPGETTPGREGLGQDLIATMAGLHARGWCDGTGGNFSCVLQRDPLQLLMAPSGVDKGSVRPEQLIVVDDDGSVVRGVGRASAETLLHLEIVRSCRAGAVLHTHSQAATLLSTKALHAEANGSGSGPSNSGKAAQLVLEGQEMLKGLDGVTTHQVRIALPVLANDQDLSRLSRVATAHLAEAPQGLLIGGHGLYAWGKDLFSARRHLEVLEFLLEQHWRAWHMEMLTKLVDQQVAGSHG